MAENRIAKWFTNLAPDIERDAVSFLVSLYKAIKPPVIKNIVQYPVGGSAVWVEGCFKLSDLPTERPDMENVVADVIKKNEANLMAVLAVVRMFIGQLDGPVKLIVQGGLDVIDIAQHGANVCEAKT
jgi:hypothetical protein